MFPALDELPGRPCPIASTLTVIGERWALLVVRDIWLGSHRFGDIVAGTGAPRDRVAARLRVLEAAGVVEKRVYQKAPLRHEYHLTASGRDLVPALQALLDWGRTHAVPEDPLRHLTDPGLAALEDVVARPALQPVPDAADLAAVPDPSAT